MLGEGSSTDPLPYGGGYKPEYSAPGFVVAPYGPSARTWCEVDDDGRMDRPVCRISSASAVDLVGYSRRIDSTDNGYLSSAPPRG